MSAPDYVLHDAPCLLSQPSMWEHRGGLGWEAMTACSCPVTDVSGYVTVVADNPAADVSKPAILRDLERESERARLAAKHDASCKLADPFAWQYDDAWGDDWTRRDDCTCPPATLPASMQPDIDEKDRLVAEAFTRTPADPDLPHPGISDEFWAEVPEADRETFSAYLVKQEAVKLISEGMQVPYGLLDVPEVTARRGGIQFTGGWCAPSGTVYHTKPLTKKQWRALAERTEKALQRERKLSAKKDRRIAKLLRIIERLG